METIIHFEDNGQDFLTWKLDDDRIVTACEPFQGSIWEGSAVLNQKLRKGMKPVIRISIDGKSKLLQLNHRIERIEMLEDSK